MCSPLLLDFDREVMPVAGGLGLYTRRLVLLTGVPMRLIGFSQFSDSFLLDQPGDWCRGNATAHRLLAPTGGPVVGPEHNMSHSRGLLEHPAHAEDPQLGKDCQCSEWSYQIRAGLGQNVVSKLRMM